MIAAYASVYSECVPREPMTEEEVRRGLERNPERRLFTRGDDAVAMVGRSSLPGCARIAVWVRPDARGRGLGAELYDEAAAYARTLDGVDAFFAKAHGGDGRSVEFALRRGFAEFGREVELVRELRGDEAEPRFPAGVEVAEVTPELHAAAYELAVECVADMPFDPPLDIEPFERWVEEELPGPVGFVALDGERVVGLASLIAHEARPGSLEHGLTAVARSHRGRGLARALKQRCVVWAAERGYRELTTWTQDGNASMRAVNRRVGFVEQPPWIMFRKELG